MNLSLYDLDAHEAALRDLSLEVRSLSERLDALSLGQEEGAGSRPDLGEGDSDKDALHKRARFLVDMSRRMRTPLAGALGMLELLGETRLTKKQRALLEQAAQASRGLEKVCEEVMDYFQIESGELVLEPHVVELRPLVESVVAAQAARAEERGIRLGLEVDESLPERVRVDPARLTRVLTELVENAIEHTFESRVQVGVRLLDTEEPGDRLLFWVSDTGCGIESEDLTEMFDLWSQRETSGNVLAIGLPAAKRLVEAMQGHLDIESEPGEGTTVRFTLPHEAARERAADRKPEPPADLERRPAQVLVVEDDRVNQRVAIGFLEARGYVAAGANDGAEALARLEEEAFDMVLMDCMMPGMDGYEATRAIRAKDDPGAPRIPIIALTADVSTESRRGCLEAGMDDYLTKPIQREEFDKAVRTWVPPHLRPAREA